LIAPALQEWIELLQQSADMLSGDDGKGSIDLAFISGFDNDQLLAERSRCGLRVAAVEIRDCVVGIYEKGDRFGFRKELAQQFKPLGYEHFAQRGNAGDVSSRSVEMRHKAELHRVAAGCQT
jgi:hypothetical protein